MFIPSIIYPPIILTWEVFWQVQAFCMVIKCFSNYPAYIRFIDRAAQLFLWLIMNVFILIWGDIKMFKILGHPSFDHISESSKSTLNPRSLKSAQFGITKKVKEI